MSSTGPIQHFTHVHPLTKFDVNGKFICNGCNTDGFRITYRCVSCDYDLHDHCATCPPTLLSFMHPQHELQRVFRRLDKRQQNRRICDICGELVHGLYYHCEPCGFDIHPLCTQLPQYVKHVAHPDHLLELSHFGACNMCEICQSAIPSWRYKCGLCSTVDFICDGCKTYGTGKTYRCEPCNYYLHEYCATCPLTLQTFIHPQHELNLVVRKEQSMRNNNRWCNICREAVEGLFYRCKLCDFDMHPLCTQLPQHVRHVLHPAHHLEFGLGDAGACTVCSDKCQSWRYRCELCKFNIHVECILAVLPSDQTETLGTTSRRPNPHGQPSSSALSMGQVSKAEPNEKPTPCKETESGIFRQILQGKLDFKSDPWPSISEAAKDLINKMLERSPKKSISAHEALCMFHFGGTNSSYLVFR